ncbi:hypothetical protein EVA_11987 [gut metagenome]|uniref:Uncharacterized protein n=1 Tax=gut metagenome TaxID=749906 RepID=J9CIK6_9ZZZZ
MCVDSCCVGAVYFDGSSRIDINRSFIDIDAIGSRSTSWCFAIVTFLNDGINTMVSHMVRSFIKI